MYKTMHEKANAKTAKPTPASITRASQTQPLITRSSAPQPPQSAAPANAAPANAQSTNAPAQSTPNATPAKLDKTLFDLLTDVTAELIVESAKLDRLGRYLTKNPKNQK